MKINRVMILPHEHNSDGTLKIKIKLRASKFQKKSILWTHIQWDAGNCLKTSTQKNKERKHFLKHSSTSLYIIHLCLQNCCKSYINKSIKNITPNHKTTGDYWWTQTVYISKSREWERDMKSLWQMWFSGVSLQSVSSRSHLSTS